MPKDVPDYSADPHLSPAVKALVHTGQLLGYLRTIGTERPDIWD